MSNKHVLKFMTRLDSSFEIYKYLFKINCIVKSQLRSNAQQNDLR